MELIRVQNPTIVRKNKRRLGKDWRRCFRIFPFIVVFLMLLAFSFYAKSQNTKFPRELHIGYSGFTGSKNVISINHNPYEYRVKPSIVADTNPFKVGSLLPRRVLPPEYWAKYFTNRVQKQIEAYRIENAFAEELCLEFHNCSTVDSVLGVCPQYPETLIGRTNISSPLTNVSDEDIFQITNLTYQGEWKPADCDTKYVVAVIIPYRDRKEHLTQLLYHLHPLLQRQKIHYRIFVIEQFGNGTFNKGAIMNAGFITIVEGKMFPGTKPYNCYVFHDVDMIPENDHNLYSCSRYPTHLSVAVNEMGYKLPYYELVGGVFKINFDQFLKVNGYSNLFWGWGGEDDDMGYRLSQVDLPIVRPLSSIGRYTMIKHVKRQPLVFKVRSKLVKTSKRRFRLDGLNTIKFQLKGVIYHPFYTKLIIDVGVPPDTIQQLQDEYENKSEMSTKQQTSV